MMSKIVENKEYQVNLLKATTVFNEVVMATSSVIADSKNPRFNSDYASLNAITLTLRESCHRHETVCGFTTVFQRILEHQNFVKVIIKFITVHGYFEQDYIYFAPLAEIDFNDPSIIAMFDGNFNALLRGRKQYLTDCIHGEMTARTYFSRGSLILCFALPIDTDRDGELGSSSTPIPVSVSQPKFTQQPPSKPTLKT